MASKPFFKSKFELVVYCFIVVLVALRLVGAYQEARHKQSAILDPVPAPDFVWRDFASDTHKFQDLSGKGKVIILHFWASWCGPCRVELPSLLRTADALKDDVIVLTISGDEDDAPAKKFLLTAKSAAGVSPDNVLYGFDAMKSVIFDKFQTIAFPETFIIDTNFKMRRKLAGLQHWDDQKLVDYIQALKREGDVKPKTDAPQNTHVVPTP